MNLVATQDLKTQIAASVQGAANMEHGSRTCNANPQQPREQQKREDGCFKLFGFTINKTPEQPDDNAGKISSQVNLELCSKNNDAEQRAINVGAIAEAEYISAVNLELCRKNNDAGQRTINDGAAAEAEDISDDNTSSSNRATTRNPSRKRGTPWTDDEHNKFLQGLAKLGKGNWKGIAQQFVSTRTSIQVASHAQKYFLRKFPTENRKRRRSVFDVEQGRNTTSTTSQVPNLSASQTIQGLPHYYVKGTGGAQSYPVNMNRLYVSFVNMMNAMQQPYTNFGAWAPVSTQITRAQQPPQNLEGVATRDFLNGNTNFN